MNALLRPALPVLIALVGLLAACTSAGPSLPPPGLSGTWSGEGRVVVNWVQREYLPVVLAITEDGAVTGRVGDAQLVDAHVRSNRNEVGRRLGWWTDWIVEGRLDGELLDDEDFVAQRVSIPFNFVAGRIDGGLHAHGAFLDGRRADRLSVAGLELVRR